MFSPYFAFGKGIRSSVIQGKVAADLPADTDRVARSYRYAVAYSFPSIGFSRTGYVPALELTGVYNSRSQVHSQTAVIGLSKALNKLGHVIGSVGMGIPLQSTGGSRPKEFRAYLLWDFGDGPLWTGW